MQTKSTRTVLFLALASFGLWLGTASAADKKVILIAGSPSHGPGQHDHPGGVKLLHRCLQDVPGIVSVCYAEGWPKDPKAFESADAILLYADGGGGNPAIQGDRLKVLGEAMKRGAGFICLHYAVEVPKERGGQEFLQWMGGYFETYWSVNPFWDAAFKEFPKHPITQGVKPFKVRDEWYYHMRFPENLKGVTPILTAVPPERTRMGADSTHGGNPHVRARQGMPEHVAWAYERPDGGRGFGFTGGHTHANWGEEGFRKIVLNAILWTAKVEVPANGVECAVTAQDLEKSLTPKPR